MLDLTTAVTRTRRRSVLVLATVVVLSMLAALQLGRLRLDVSAEGFRLEGDRAVEVYEMAGSLFGREQVAVILLNDHELFATDKLESIRGIQDSLTQLDGIAEVHSLFNAPHLRVVDDFIQSGPYIESTPLSDAAVDALIADANADPFVSGTLISRDGTTLALQLVLSAEGDDAVALYDEIENTIAPLHAQLSVVRQINPAMIDRELQERILADIGTIGPIALAILFTVMFACCRSARLALLPLITAGVSILWLLGLLPWLGLSLNILTSLVPALLVIIGSTEDIHLIAEYRAARESQRSRSGAIATMMRRMLVITAITAFTSFVGMASITLNPIQMMREFSLVASLGLALNYLITILLVPAYLNCIETCAGATGCRTTRWLSRANCERYYGTLWRHRRKLLLMAVAGLCVGLASAPGVRVDGSLVDFMAVDSPTLRNLARMEEKLAGANLIRIVIEAPHEGALKTPAMLKQIDKLQRYLRGSETFEHNLSLVDLIALSYSLVNDSGKRELPTEQSIVDELLLFIEDEKLSRFVDKEFRRTVVYVRHELLSSPSFAQAVEALERFIRSDLDDRLHITVTGEAVITGHALDTIASGQVLSLLATLGLVFVISAVMMGDARGGVIAVTVNTIPLAVMFATISLVGLSFNISTAMVATIAFGISVDYTLHFLQRYRQHLNLLEEAREAMIHTLQEESLAIITTTLTLTAGMSCFLLSAFPSVATFGLLCVEVLCVSFIANFTITPLLVTMLGIRRKAPHGNEERIHQGVAVTQ